VHHETLTSRQGKRDLQDVLPVPQRTARDTACVRALGDGTFVAMKVTQTKEVIHMLTKFKLALATTVALVGGVAGFAAAQGRDKPDQDRKAMHAERKAEMLAKFDANKDGQLDDAEKDAMKAERAALQFSHLDKDGDGKLSLDEFKAAKHHQGRGGRGGFRGHGRGGFRGQH
jgi:hypothetical protein